MAQDLTQEPALLAVAEIVAASVPTLKKCGIYFLIKGGEIKYVGQSVNIDARLGAHHWRGFDRYLMSYGLLTGDGYTHGAVKHAAKEWSWYDWRTGETFHTNSVEGFWRLFKASVRSTHIHVSEKRMPAYLAEFCYRSNHRQFGNAMFDLLISRV